MKTDKQKFLAALQALANQAVQLAQSAQVIDWQYWKMLYGAGNTNQITDAEASAIGATAADVAAAIVAVEAIMAPLVTQDQIKAFFKIA
jgi:hypothetical protein